MSENNAIRAVMNQEVAEEWTKWSSSDKKTYIREKIFKNTSICEQVMEEYRKEELNKYNPEEQIDYLLERIWQRIQKLNIPWKSIIQKNVVDSKIASIEMMERFKN